MKKLWISATCLLAAVAVTGALEPESAQARAPYKKEFDAMYAPTSEMEPFKSAKCNICHVGEKKKDRNVYGQALAKLLQKGDEKDLPKVKSALETVGKESSDPSKPDAPTFGDLIKSGKLPG